MAVIEEEGKGEEKREADQSVYGNKKNRSFYCQSSHENDHLMVKRQFQTNWGGFTSSPEIGRTA